jgi:hypothetical protein
MGGMFPKRVPACNGILREPDRSREQHIGLRPAFQSPWQINRYRDGLDRAVMICVIRCPGMNGAGHDSA